MDEAKALELYKFFQEEGYDVGGEADFLKALEDDFKRKELYDFFTEQEGYDLGKIDDFILKKKDISLDTSQEEVMVSDTEVQAEEPGSSESLDQNQTVETTTETQQTTETEGQPQLGTVFPNTDQEFSFEPQEAPEAPVVEEVTYDAREVKPDATISYAKDASPFERSIAYITGDMIEREEEEVVARMNYLFGDYGFEFDEQGMGDSMKVTSLSTGETLDVNLDPNFGIGSEKIANELQEFLITNKADTPEMDVLTDEYDASKKKYFSKKAVEADIQGIQSNAAALSKRYENYLKDASETQANIDMLMEKPELTPEEVTQYNNLLARKKSLNVEKQKLQADFEEFKAYNSQLEIAVGNYVSMKESMGNKFSATIKGFYNMLVGKGLTRPISSLVGGGYDVYYGLRQAFNPDYGMDEQEKKEKYIEVAKDLGLVLPDNIEDDKVFNDWLSGLTENEGEPDEEYLKKINEKLISEGYDPTKILSADGLKMYKKDGGLLGIGGYEDIPAYYFDKNQGQELVRLVKDRVVKEAKNPTKQAIRDGLDFMLAEGVSDELIDQMRKDSFFYEGIFGLGESAPSIALYLLGRGKGPKPKQGAKGLLNKTKQSFQNYITNRGAVAQTIGFSLLQTDHLMQEMENDPDFKNVTETEKKAITLPLALTTALLERYGLRSIARNRTITTGLMSQVTKLLPKGATPKMFKEMTEKVIKNNIAKGIYVVGAAGLAEAETGALQQVAEIKAKNVWNDMNEKDMFNTPEMWSEEFTEQVIRAGLAEMVGGLVLGTPRALSTAFSKGQIDEISDDMVELFNQIKDDKITVDAFKTQLDLKVANKEITKEEAQKELLNFEILSSAATTVKKSGELTPEQTKKALGLVYLKNKVESEMEGMDPDMGTYKTKEALLNTIKDKLSKIGTDQEGPANLKEKTTKTKEDAIQESSTEKMDVQESPQDSQEVGDGDTQGQVAPESQTQDQSDTETQTQEEVTPEGRADQIQELIEKESADTDTEPQVIPEEQLEKVDETISINKAVKPPVKQNTFKENVIRRTKLAGKALKKIVPNVKIIMHESSENFKKATGKNRRGAFIDNTIHINLEEATNSTVAHEAFHAILVSKLKTDTNTRAVTKRMMESINKALPTNDPLRKKIEEFTQAYEENIQNEEKLAEVLGSLSSNYTQLSAPQKGVLRRWVDAVAKKLGIKINEFTQEDQDVIDLLNTLSTKITTGLEIQKEDIKSIKKPSKKRKAKKEDKKPADREQRKVSRKDKLFKLGNQYGMKPNDFFPSALFNPQALRKRAQELGYTLEALYSQEGYDKGRLTGYAFYTKPRSQGGSMVKFPSQRKAGPRFQEILNKFNDPIEIIKLARQAGFEDSEIKFFLRTRKNMKVKEINDLLKVELSLFETMPPAFGNIPGGMNAGVKLYQLTLRKFNSLLEKNKKKPENKRQSVGDIINETIEFMMEQPAYKKATEGVKSKTLPSTLQQQLQIEMYEALGGAGVKNISRTISRIKKIVKEKIRGAREIRSVKRELQRALRETLPPGEYTKTEIKQLLRTIQEAEPKWLKGNLQNLVQQIEELAAKKNVSALQKNIDNIFKNKWVIKVSGLAKGVKIDLNTRKILESIQEKLYRPAEIEESIVKEQEAIIEKIDEINRKTDLTAEDETNLLILNTALAINSSKLMEDNNPRKADQLNDIYNNLKALIVLGRNNYKESITKRKKRYADNTAKFYQALTKGKKVLDFTDSEVLEKIKEDIKKRQAGRTSEEKNQLELTGRERIVRFFNRLGQSTYNLLAKLTLDTAELASTLDRLPGEVMGEGFIPDFIYRKQNESTRIYKESIMALNSILEAKTQEYLGKDGMKKLNKEYRRYLDFTKLEGGKFMKDPAAVKEAQDNYDANPTKANEKKLQQVQRENIPFSGLTPMELMYLYYQYKQSDTHPGFETALGKNYESIMDGLSKYFEDNYADLVKLGDWHVNTLFPRLYEKYNEVYKKIYNTDLPQRENYSGRTFRTLSTKSKLDKMQENKPLALLNEIGTSQMGVNVIGNSTKLTVKNKNAIRPVDFFSSVDSYLKDMEHFAAYAENQNEINKVFFNEIIADEIIAQYGQDFYDTIVTALTNTATRGSLQSDALVSKINSYNNVFILQKLGAGLSIYLKQLTSFVAYGNRIGFRNWIKTAATMGPKEFIKTWQEISEESVYVKYRYWETINKSIEAYGEKQVEGYTPGDKGDKLIRFFMSPIKAGDKQAIYVGGIPMYVYLKNKFIKEGMSEDAAKKKAMLIFEEQTKKVQQSSDKQDRDNIQNMGGYVQFFNMFMSAPKSYLRRLFGGYRELSRNIKDGSGKGTWWDNLRTIGTYQFALPMIFQWATSGFPITDWDDEDKEDLARSAVLSVFNSIFVVGQIVEMIADRYQGKPWWKDVKQFPVLDLATDVIDKIARGAETEDPDKALEYYKEAIYALLPLTAGPVPVPIASMPLPTLDRMAQNIKKMVEGGADPKEIFLRLFNYSDYVIEGKPEKKEKKSKLRKSEIKEYMPELYEQMESFKDDPSYKEMQEEIKKMKQEKKALREEFLKDAYEN